MYPLQHNVFPLSGFDVNTVLKCGWTGLMYAANSANKQIVEFLVNKGANVKCHHGKIL